jgi:hypothetical protein
MSEVGGEEIKAACTERKREIERERGEGMEGVSSLSLYTTWGSVEYRAA